MAFIAGNGQAPQPLLAMSIDAVGTCPIQSYHAFVRTKASLAYRSHIFFDRVLRESA
jgi:hypothetical protein